MIAVFIVNMFVIGLAVVIHYEFLHQLTTLMPKLKLRHRFRIVLGVFVTLTAHAAEVWIFGITYYFMNKSESWAKMAKILLDHFDSVENIVKASREELGIVPRLGEKTVEKIYKVLHEEDIPYMG